MPPVNPSDASELKPDVSQKLVFPGFLGKVPSTVSLKTTLLSWLHFSRYFVVSNILLKINPELNTVLLGGFK